MNCLVVLVVCAASLVHAAPNHWAAAPAYPAAPAPAAAPEAKWHGPLASPTVLASGFLADTPEVAALKSAHSASAGAPAGYAPASYGPASYAGVPAAAPAPAPAPAAEPKWHGPLASPTVLASGFLADTPEVAALKTAHVGSAPGGAGHGHGYYH